MSCLDLLVTNLRGLSPTEFIFKVENFTDILEAHSVYNQCPEHVPGFAKLRELTVQYKVALVAAENGGKDRNAQKNDVREEIQQGIEIQGHHMVMVAIHRKDMSLLDGVGLDLKHRSYAKNTDSWNPRIPLEFTVARGPETGTVIVTVSKIKGAPSIDLQETTGDPADESSYNDMGVFAQFRFKVENLETLKKHHFRGRYHRGTVAGPWSQIQSVVVL